MQAEETWVQSLGWEDPLEEEMATRFSILAWRIPWTEEPGVAKSQRQLSNEQSHVWKACNYFVISFYLPLPHTTHKLIRRDNPHFGCIKSWAIVMLFFMVPVLLMPPLMAHELMCTLLPGNS